MAHQCGRAQLIQEATEFVPVFRIRLGIHGDRGLGDHFLQHPDAAAGADGQSNGITGARINLQPVIAFQITIAFIVVVCFIIEGLQPQHRAKGAVFDGVDDHPLQPQPPCFEQSGHEVVAERPGLGRVVEAGHDVVGLGLINPDRHLTGSGWISQQHDRAATAGIKGDSRHAHLDQGRLRRSIDYEQMTGPRKARCSRVWSRRWVASSGVVMRCWWKAVQLSPL